MVLSTFALPARLLRAATPACLLAAWPAPGASQPVPACADAEAGLDDSIDADSGMLNGRRPEPVTCSHGPVVPARD